MLSFLGHSLACGFTGSYPMIRQKTEATDPCIDYIYSEKKIKGNFGKGRGAETADCGDSGVRRGKFGRK